MILLTKSSSTQHIPENVRAKNSKRYYANFDKDLAGKMFGYRVTFARKNQKIKPPEPRISQAHKPLAKFASEIIHEISLGYVQIPKYGTK